jgi:hypothetical protein
VFGLIVDVQLDLQVDQERPQEIQIGVAVRGRINFRNISEEIGIQCLPRLCVPAVPRRLDGCLTDFGDDQSDRSNGDQKEREECSDKYEEEKNERNSCRLVNNSPLHFGRHSGRPFENICHHGKIKFPEEPCLIRYEIE